MTTYRTGNAIGSADPRDLYDNAENLDELVNSESKLSHPDRLGVPRKTWYGMEADFQAFLQSSGYQDLGDYAPGIEITARNQIIRADGELWRISASIELPYTTTGDWAADSGDFVAMGDAVLRQDLANGSAQVFSSTGGQTLADALDQRAIVINIFPSDSQAQIADALASAPDGSTIVFNPGVYAGLVKDTTLIGFPNNDQPCLLLRGKHGVRVLGFGATLATDIHAQGILELQECSDCRIEGLTVTGAGNFPQLDGSTGRGEKGTSDTGYHTSGFWGYFKNNSSDTSADNRGGFGGSFPQFGGGTASTWGVWSGGYIGNISYGILIHNDCHNITLVQCKATGFNYVGLGVGHNGDFFPTELGYPESSNITFERCVGNENYSAGFHAMHVSGMNIVGGEAARNGHPGADMASDSFHDPGYGVTIRGSAYYAKEVDVSGLRAHHNVRKGIDAHAGYEMNIHHNKVHDNGICGIYSAWSSDSQPASSCIISENFLDNNSNGNSGLLGSIYVGGQSASGTVGDTLILNNHIRRSGFNSIHSRYLSHVGIRGNKIRGSGPKASNAHIAVDAEGSATETDIDVSGNNIWDDDGYMSRGIQLSRITDGLLFGNKVSMYANGVNMGIYCDSCEGVDVISNTSRLGSLGMPLNINQSNGQNYGNIAKGGDGASLLYTNGSALGKAQVPDVFSFTINFNGGTPTITSSTAPDITGVASSFDQGVQVSFSGIPSVARVRAHYTVRSANGLVIDNVTNDPFLYTRSISNGALEIGMKPVASGIHRPASDFTSGSLEVTVIVS